MKNLVYVFLIGLVCSCNSSEETIVINSPDNNIVVEFQVLSDGTPSYSVSCNDSLVILPSELGLLMTESEGSTQVIYKGASEEKEVTDLYKMLHGKSLHNIYQANERTIFLADKKGNKMNLIFRVSDDGVAFKYVFPGSSDELHHIEKELTSFNFRPDARAWLQPLAEVNTGWAETNPSYEEHYLQNIPVGTPCPTKAGWAFPVLFKSAGSWISITETGLNPTFCGTRLENIPGTKGYKIGFPMAEEGKEGEPVYPESVLPWESPWRILTIGSLATLTESTLGSDLADPVRIEDSSWIKPGRASWSWALLKDNSVNYKTQVRFIDYASDMGWEYCLIDVNWDTRIGYERMEELISYANYKNVGVLLWYNSSGNWNKTEYTPKSALVDREERRKEFARIHAMGASGVKVDFFAGDGQSMVAYYHEIFEDAAEFKLLVNCHGTTLPRGWQRTYPNVLTMESIKGFEFATFGQEDNNKVPTMSCMIPFTRNIFDPMDFTPVAFSEIPGINRVTTNTFELALSVIFLSGIQHFAETPTGMAQVRPEVKEFMSTVPVNWVATKFISGYPGKHVVVARKYEDFWYVAGINGTSEKMVQEIQLGLFGGTEVLHVFEDGKDKREMLYSTTLESQDSKVKMEMAPNGGFVIVLKVLE